MGRRRVKLYDGYVHSVAVEFSAGWNFDHCRNFVHKGTVEYFCADHTKLSNNYISKQNE